MAYSKKRIIDWEAIEREYRPGIRSLRDIASEFGISEALIRQKAKQQDWARDLTARIKLKSDQIIRNHECAKASRETSQASERVLIEAVAQNQAFIQIKHRKRIQGYSELGDALFAELNAQTVNKEAFETLGELMRHPNSRDKLNDIYKKVIDTPSRIDSYKKLAEATKTLVGLERQAYGIADNANGEADKPPVSKEILVNMKPIDAYRQLMND